MRAWMIFFCFLFIVCQIIFGLGFHDGIREARGMKNEMHEVNVQLKCLNVYMAKIAP